MVLDVGHARVARALCTAVKGLVGLYAVADDLAPAVIADRSKLVNRALEAVERVPAAGRNNVKRKIIIVTADLTNCHQNSPS
jgi:hypothetical protein